MLRYYLALSTDADRHADNVQELLDRLLGRVDVIAEVLAAQQHVGATAMTEACDIREIIRRAIHDQGAKFSESKITVESVYETEAKVLAQRPKLLKVLGILLDNAREAMVSTPETSRSLSIFVRQERGKVLVAVKDTGGRVTRE